MKLIVNDEQRISSLQQQFKALFPFLKLEFFSKRHKPGKRSHLKFMLKPEMYIRDIRSIHVGGEITVTPERSVAELEQSFGTLFGLGVQVFRKSGNHWLETVQTDNWSLQRQNAEGELLST